MRFTLLFLISLSIVSTVLAQQLPSNPDPNKCYVREVTPDVYEVEYEDVLTYSWEEAQIYAHTFLEIELSPEIDKSEFIYHVGCENILGQAYKRKCNELHAVRLDTIYVPTNDALGNPYFTEVERLELVKTGERRGYVEVDCNLSSYNSLTIRFLPGTADFDDPEKNWNVLDDRLLQILDRRPEIQINVNVYTDAKGDEQSNQELSELRAEAIVNYLISRGISDYRVLTKGYGKSQPVIDCPYYDDCLEAEHRVNNRVTFKVVRNYR
jgi:outer membrane protein OmpA-like peptidoglycan-associated protein